MKLTNFHPDYGCFPEHRVNTVIDALEGGVTFAAKKNNVGKTTVRRWLNRITVRDLANFIKEGN